MKLNIAVPTWLKPGLTITEEDEKRFTDIASNWVKLFNNRTDLTELECLKLICWEFNGKKRPDIIARVKHWYNTMRHEREIIELWNGKDNA